MEFLALTCEEALFGGAAGGGKSDAGLMAALQYIDVPGYSAGIFRRTKVDLLMPDAILARARLWFAGAEKAGLCRWDDESNTYFFQTKPGQPESSIHFGYLTHDRDLLRYQGARFHFLFVDELGQWIEKHYRYLFSRVRRLKHEAIPLRVRASANPGGPGQAWVKERFIEHARHVMTGRDVREDLRAMREKGTPLPAPRLYVSPPSGDAMESARLQGLQAEGAHFVPSFAADNPGLDLATYRAQLARLDPITRAQLDQGDWDALASGQFFNVTCFEWTDVEPPNVRWIRSWDFAATKETPGKDPDWSVGGKVGLWMPSPQAAPRFVVAHIERFREDPGPTERRVVATASSDGKRVPILMEQEPGSAGKTVITNWQTRPLLGYQVIPMRKTGPKEEYWKPLSGFANVSPILLVRGQWNKAYVEEMTSLPVGHDDQADSTSQGFGHLTGAGAAAARARAQAG